MRAESSILELVETAKVSAAKNLNLFQETELVFFLHLVRGGMLLCFDSRLSAGEVLLCVSCITKVDCAAQISTLRRGFEEVRTEKVFENRHSRDFYSSFRMPLHCCTICLISGNLLYGLRLQCNSVAFAFLGRVLTGLGSSRVICRRFIVDHVPLRDRTDASRNFITAGALG